MVPVAVYRALLAFALALVVLQLFLPDDLRARVFILSLIIFVTALVTRWPGRGNQLGRKD